MLRLLTSSSGNASLATVAALMCALSMTACEPGGGAGLVSGLTGIEGDPAGNPWFGVYRGTGQGSIAGVPIMPADAVLRIRPDADTVRLESCSRCFTVQLDTLFTLFNVEPGSTVSLDLGYAQDGVRRSLRLDRYSASGGIGNVVNANLSLSGGVTGVVEYVLERR